MKTNTIPFFLLFFPIFIFSQNAKEKLPAKHPVTGSVITPLFEKIEDGALVGKLSDSRSVNFVDVNNDGWEDVFITNGANPGTKSLLYLNDGTGDFEEVNSGTIVSHAEPFVGASFADADNDGDLDIMAVTWYEEKNYLYAGVGNGTFFLKGAAAPSTAETYSETAAWGDMDNDGDLDLYVTNSTNNLGAPLKNILYENDGSGNFTTVNNGPAAEQIRASRSVNWVDFDNDCDMDLFVSNESNQPDDLYVNDGNGNFTEAPNPPSQSSRSTMSSSWGDVDNDGDLDLFVSNAAYFGVQNNQLFINNGNGTFSEITTDNLVIDGGCSYGSNFGDYDNDGDLDLVVSNGYCNGSILNFLYKNDGAGKFSRDIESIEDLSTPCSYGAVWGDINNDGFLDLGIATCKNSPNSSLSSNIFYRNLGNNNNWLKIKPVGSQFNRSAIGAKVFVTADINGVEITQMREISAQSGYCGQNSLYAHFGLADATEVKKVRVQFSCGQELNLTNVAANQLIEVLESDINSIGELFQKEKIILKITPNPINDQFIVSINSNEFIKKAELTLIDTTGRIIWKNEVENIPVGIFEKSFATKNIKINPGSYILKLEANEIQYSEAVLIY